MTGPNSPCTYLDITILGTYLSIHLRWPRFIPYRGVNRRTERLDLASRGTLTLLQLVGEARKIKAFVDKLAVIDEVLLGLLKISLERLDLAFRI